MSSPEKIAAASRLAAQRLGKIAIAAVEAGEALEEYAQACERGRAGLVALPDMALALEDVQRKMQALISLTANCETEVQKALGA